MVLERWCVVVEVVDQRVGVRWISSDTERERARERDSGGKRKRERLSQLAAGLPQYKVDFFQGILRQQSSCSTSRRRSTGCAAQWLVSSVDDN